jgi:RNA polymerase sigma factor (sigma-70 family)
VEDLHEGLARDRRRYERLVYGRLRGGICWQDAEDIVSDALMRAHTSAKADPPQRGKEQAWFTRIVFNQGVDFLRARDGRRREGSRPRPDLVSLDELETSGVELADDIGGDGSADAWIDALDSNSERAQAQEIVERVLSRMAPQDAELVKLRHLLGADASREEVAAMAGLTLGEFRWRYARAWARFVETISADRPTQRCQDIRSLIGELHAAAAPVSAAAQIDAHVLDCPSCRVFARDSYRILELLPFVPAIGIAERWTARLAALWERCGPEAAAGGAAATATGTGAAGIAGAGAGAGALKALVGVCGTAAVTAGVCAGVVVMSDAPDSNRRPPARHGAAKQTPRTSANLTPAATAGSSAPARPANATSGTTAAPDPKSAIATSAPSGSREFDPAGSGVPRQPAPTPSSGGGEFGP